MPVVTEPWFGAPIHANYGGHPYWGQQVVVIEEKKPKKESPAEEPEEEEEDDDLKTPGQF